MKNERKTATSGAPQFSVLSITRMLWKRRVLTFATWILATGGAFLIVRTLPNVYEAEAVVLVDSQKIPEKFVASTVQVTLQDSLNAIKQRVEAGDRLRQIIRDFHLYEDQWGKKSEEELMERLRSRDLTLTLERGMGGGSRMNAFRVTFEGKSPKEVAGVVNRITDLFIRENANVREGRAQGTAEFIESQLRAAKKRLDEQEAAVSQYKIQNSGELPEQSAALLSILTGLRSQLQGNRDSLNRVQQNILILESTLRFTESSLQAALRPLTPAAKSSDPLKPGEFLPVARSPLPSDVLKARLAELRIIQTDNHPDVRLLKDQLDRALASEAKSAEARRALVAEAQRTAEAQQAAHNKDGSSVPAAPPTAAEASPQAIAEINQLRDRLFSTKTQLDAAQREMGTLTTEKTDITRQIADYENRIEKLPVREQQLAALMRDYDISQVSYRQLLDRKYDAGVATAMEESDESERFIVTDPAREPSKPIRPKRTIYLAGGSFFGLIVGMVLGLILELKRNAFLGEWEVPPGIPILGRIPAIARVPARAPSFTGLGLTLCVISTLYGMLSCRLIGSLG